jgi:hypothetical protein
MYAGIVVRRVRSSQLLRHDRTIVPCPATGGAAPTRAVPRHNQARTPRTRAPNRSGAQPAAGDVSASPVLAPRLVRHGASEGSMPAWNVAPGPTENPFVRTTRTAARTVTSPGAATRNAGPSVRVPQAV